MPAFSGLGRGLVGGGVPGAFGAAGPFGVAGAVAQGLGRAFKRKGKKPQPNEQLAQMAANAAQVGTPLATRPAGKF